MGVVAYFQHEMPVFQQNMHLATPDRYTVKTSSRDIRHDETWKLETEPRQHIQEPRPSQDRDMKKSRDSLETRHVSQDSITALYASC